MQALDNIFFEAYKRLDRLCSDMYGCRSGVSQYIQNMESQSYRGRFVVPMWEQSYKTLKHLRWVRNQIAHDSGQFQICEEYDIQDINEFYDSIISGQDPLTRLHKADAAVKKPVHCAEPVSVSPTSHSRNAIPPRHTGYLIAAVWSITVVFAIIAYLLLHFL